MPYGTYAECPCCKKKAYKEKEIEEKFGYRDMGDGRIIPQSYCRACRSAGCKAGQPCRVGEN
ncbi:hypothetical protein [Selenomonas ruminantium]|uniref:hypothetical protein n=1 Tax=Selenomonas ruminantium TaxID=971 RepID=UPI0008FFDDF1|nr:hypothetical protein [Selenomonas ruminantium]